MRYHDNEAVDMTVEDLDFLESEAGMLDLVMKKARSYITYEPEFIPKNLDDAYLFEHSGTVFHRYGRQEMMVTEWSDHFSFQVLESWTEVALLHDRAYNDDEKKGYMVDVYTNSKILASWNVEK